MKDINSLVDSKNNIVDRKKTSILQRKKKHLLVVTYEPLFSLAQG